MKVRYNLPDGTVVERDVPGIPGKSAYEYAKDGGYTGTPEEFAAKLASESPKAFYITVSGDAENGYTVDKTSSEILAAYNNGCTLFAAYPNDDLVWLPLVNTDVTDGFAIFAMTLFPYVYILALNLGEDAVSVDHTEASEVNAEMVGALPADTVIPEVPATLPNPHALTINGNVYDGSKPVEISVSGADADTEMVLSDNLFDKSIAISGKTIYYGSSGYQLVDAADMCYAFVPLRGAGTYRTKIVWSQHNSTGGRLALVDDNDNWVTAVTGTVTETTDANAYDIEFTITQAMLSSGATKLAFDCWVNNLDTVMIVKDRTYPTQYVPYGYIEVTTDSGKKMNNILAGKTAVFFGDSLCAGTTVGDNLPEYGYGWAGLIGEANRMVWGNYGRNGAVITAIDGQNRIVADQVDTALAAHATADYVIIEGGTNDADQLGDAGLGEIASDYSTFNTSTFSGALESLILKILNTYPNAKVGYIVAQKMGLTMYDSTTSVRRRYFDRAVEICKKWGIPVIDLWNGNPLNPMLPVHYDRSLDAAGNIAAGKCYTDAQHLTLAGYNKISPQIEAFMRSL